MRIDASVDVSVVICTRNRSESLRETLRCLGSADREGLRCEIVVVNNGGTDCSQLAGEFSRGMPVHYLAEPAAGKSHALNRAIAGAPLGQIVAVMDDDMSPDAGWFRGVKAIADRWPQKDFFTGRTPLIWPAEPVPEWCRNPALRGWAFSSVDAGAGEKLLASGEWFPGGHFWFRSRVLKDGRRFADMWTTEPEFMLQLVEDGYAGVMASDAVCGHRVQPELFDFEVLRNRAVRVGRDFASVRLRPYKSTVRQSRLLHGHPALGRAFCVASLAGWAARFGLAWLHPFRVARMGARLHATERIAAYREYLRIAATMDEYSLGWSRKARIRFR